MTNNIQINNSIPSNLIISNNCCEEENKIKYNFDKFINPKLKLKYILEYNWITFGYIINELGNGSSEFRKILENGGFVEKIEAIDINDGKGFTSRLLRLIINIKYTNGINIKTKNFPNKFSLILKIFADERIEILLEHFFGKERLEKESMASFTRMHQNECLFYKMMNNIENPPLPIPKIYFTKNCRKEENEEDDKINKLGPQGVILMEDLTENTHITPLTRGLNEIQIMEVVKYLAHLHAYLSLPKIKEKWQKNFVTIEEMWGQSVAEEFGSAMIEQIMELDDDIVEPFKKIGNLVIKPEFVKWMKEKCENNYGVPEILTHGDLWNNNLLWYNNNPNRLAAFIDWQLATIGNPMTDISRLMLATVEPDLRRKIEKEGKILELYLNELNKKLVELGMEKVNYGIEELQHVYNLAIISQAIGRVMEIPFFERGTPENDPEFKEKMQCIKTRAKRSINDALKILEMEAPEWLNKNEEKNGKNN
uniref:CHK kinase-like domain-containing protein n=2 Tax=Meloidogyne TaxID=189290 RepID=A0A915NHM1_9BILA